MKKVLMVVGIIILVIIVLITIYGYRNMNADVFNADFMAEEGKELGLVEKEVEIRPGNTIAYIEGPDNGPPLLLIHGQQASYNDYAKVLPELTKEFKIYALDYYGHGKSSKNPETYKGVIIGDDIANFVEKVIGEKTYITGHSSGALLTAYVSAKVPDYIIGCVLEDGPFFFYRAR